MLDILELSTSESDLQLSACFKNKIRNFTDVTLLLVASEHDFIA